MHTLDLPSVTGILSFMSEMKPLKLRNIKQLGSSQVGLVGYFPYQSTCHTVFLSIFPSEQ